MGLPKYPGTEIFNVVYSGKAPAAGSQQKKYHFMLRRMVCGEKNEDSVLHERKDYNYSMQWRMARLLRTTWLRH